MFELDTSATCRDGMAAEVVIGGISTQTGADENLPITLKE